MKQLLIALGAFLLTLFLPALILPFAVGGTPYSAFRNPDLLSSSTYMAPYHAILHHITRSDIPHEESVTVYAWQDHHNNMHFIDQDHQPIYPKAVVYDVHDQFTGHLALPDNRVLVAMLAVWLLFFGTGQLLLQGYTYLIKNKSPDPGFSQTFQEKKKTRSADTGNQRKSRPETAPSVDVLSPYQILGVQEHATQAEITAAYRKKMMEYHPDRVAHLGPELQEIAGKKAAELNLAYEALCQDSPAFRK